MPQELTKPHVQELLVNPEQQVPTTEQQVFSRHPAVEQAVGVPVARTRLGLVHVPILTQQGRFHTQGNGDVPVVHTQVEEVRVPSFTHQEVAAYLDGVARGRGGV